jgi:phage-related baseplate assembly protein
MRIPSVEVTVSHALRGLPDRMRRHAPQPLRRRRRPAPEGLVSVAGVVAAPVMHGEARVGRVSDLVVAWSRGAESPWCESWQ